MQDINVYFQKGLNAELDIIPCFLPFTSESKQLVEEHVNFHPITNIYHEGNTCTVDLTTYGMPGRPKTRYLPTENMTFVDMREPTER